MTWSVACTSVIVCKCMHTCKTVCKTRDVCIFVKKINTFVFFSLNVEPKPGSFVTRVSVSYWWAPVLLLTSSWFSSTCSLSTASDWLFYLLVTIVLRFHWKNDQIEVVCIFFLMLSWQILLFRTCSEQQTLHWELYSVMQVQKILSSVLILE